MNLDQIEIAKFNSPYYLTTDMPIISKCSVGVDNFKMCVHTSVHFCNEDYTHFVQKLNSLQLNIPYNGTITWQQTCGQQQKMSQHVLLLIYIFVDVYNALIQIYNYFTDSDYFQTIKMCD